MPVTTTPDGSAAPINSHAMRVPLTENEIRDALKSSRGGVFLLFALKDDVRAGDFAAAMIDCARAIERAHNINGSES